MLWYNCSLDSCLRQIELDPHNVFSFRYYDEVIKPKHVSATSRTWQGLIWKPITEDEMYHFLGILLRISLEPKDQGGYAAYFRPNDHNISMDSKRSFDIPKSSGFICGIDEKYRMSFNRFKQIRGAFHPEDKVEANGSDDKCYQIRAIINELNAASKLNYVPDANLAFDEGK
jgi:Transposase IS4